MLVGNWSYHHPRLGWDKCKKKLPTKEQVLQLCDGVQQILLGHQFFSAIVACNEACRSRYGANMGKQLSEITSLSSTILLTTLLVQNSAEDRSHEKTWHLRDYKTLKTYETIHEEGIAHQHHRHPCAQLWPTRPDGPLTFKGSGEPCGISSVTMPTSFLLSNAPSQQPLRAVLWSRTD